MASKQNSADNNLWNKEYLPVSHLAALGGCGVTSFDF